MREPIEVLANCDRGEQMRVCVAVCTHRNYVGTAVALNSVLTQINVSSPPRVLVIDNAPDHPKTAKTEVMKLLPREHSVEFHVEPILGVANARNLALQISHSDLIAFIDDDCIASPTWLFNLISAHQSVGSQVGAIGGKVTAIWKEQKPSWLSPAMLGYLSILDWGEDRIEIKPPRYLVGCNIIYSVPLLKAAGGFSRNLGRRGSVLLSNEEINACNALRSNGSQIIYEPRAQVSHAIRPARLRQHWFRRRVFWQVVSDLLMESENDLNNRPEDIDNRLQHATRQLTSISLKLNALLRDEPEAENFWQELLAIGHLTRILGSTPTRGEREGD